LFQKITALPLGLYDFYRYFLVNTVTQVGNVLASLTIYCKKKRRQNCGALRTVGRRGGKIVALCVHTYSKFAGEQMSDFL